MTDIYKGSSTITGKLPLEAQVVYRDILKRRDKLTLLLFALLILLTASALVWSIAATLVFIKHMKQATVVKNVLTIF